MEGVTNTLNPARMFLTCSNVYYGNGFKRLLWNTKSWFI